MFEKYIAYTKYGYITAGLLAEKLGIKHDKRIKDYPPAIRWGNSFNSFYEDDTKYNDPNLINIAANKLLTYRMLSEHNINSVQLIKGHPTNYPVLIRTTLTGSKGRGIILVNNKEEFNLDYLCYYHSPLITFNNEYRVHVLGGSIVKVMEKVPTEAGTIIKNSESCTFKRKDINIMKFGKAIKAIVEQLYSVFPLNLMGIDLGISDGIPYIIEINSAPSLNSLTLDLYVEYLKKELCL